MGYSGSTAITSDRKLKTDILDIDDKYLDFFDRLRPITYKYDCPGNKGHRDHVGFVAQEVEEALLDSGLTTEQFAGLIIEREISLNPNYDSSRTDEENAEHELYYEKLYSLRYEEFISILVKKVQSLQRQVDQLRASIPEEVYVLASNDDIDSIISDNYKETKDEDFPFASDGDIDAILSNKYIEKPNEYLLEDEGFSLTMNDEIDAIVSDAYEETPDDELILDEEYSLATDEDIDTILSDTDVET